MSAATMNEMERLRRELEQVKAERDALKREVSNRKGACCVLEQGYKRISEERDALAAHVERLTSVAEKLSTIAPEYLDHLAADANFVLRDAPATSLTRLKAEWQAEALEAVFLELEPISYRSASIMASKAAELRRQAEGGE